MAEQLSFSPGSIPASKYTLADTVITTKLSQILSTSYTDSHLRDALLALDLRTKTNTIETRRSLRAKTEDEIVKTHGAIINKFSGFAANLEEIGANITQLNVEFKQMEHLLGKISTPETREVITHNKQLTQDAQDNYDQQILLETFQKTFFITVEEEDILTAPTLPVDDSFFTVLSKVKNIYEDCQALLAIDDNSQDPATGSTEQMSGIMIMNRMSSYLDSAYDKLFYKVQRDLKAFSGENIRVDRGIQRSFNVLSERPALLDNIVASLLSSRQKSLSAEFMNTLTVESSFHKPLDFYAYDCLRYVGDLLAWVHSVIINERENLDILFYASKNNQALASDVIPGQFIIVDTINDLVDKTTGVLIKPLKTRIEQSVSSQTSPSQLYKLMVLIDFYQSMYLKYLHPEFQLILTLGHIRQFVLRTLDRCLQDRAVVIRDNSNLLNSSSSTVASLLEDLTPPEFLSEIINELKAILNAFESSLTYDPTLDTPPAEMKHIIESSVEPYLEYCRRIASDMNNLAQAEIFLLNCYDSTKVGLQLYKVAAYKINHLNSRISELRQVLVDILYNRFIRSSGLKPQINILENFEAKLIKISGTEEFKPEVLAELSFSLDDFLPSALMDCRTFLFKLTSPEDVEIILNDSFKRFADSFERVESFILNNYKEEGMPLDEVRSFFPRTTADVKILLDL
ncbi:oligomeric complex COG6 [Nadsonia fulvescens var. elongata DSM 6958]|uniref:Conserved oligomeric Golgi complex subunit 6 n=1 Tax=Nadsonia fulvescens var. elongata DSM 6958 TaxID=857566 RepID=A0A1E3PL83_9ASCO|nr:oligomeric complex COG6 [Nadsonia fulvescens var. elongata DSM 6958]